MADTLHGFGLGVASKNSRGEILDVYYPAPLATISGELASALDGVSGEIDAPQPDHWQLISKRGTWATGGCCRENSQRR